MEFTGFDRTYLVERSLGLLIMVVGLVIVLFVVKYLGKSVSEYIIVYIILALIVFVYFEYKHWSGEYADQIRHTTPVSRDVY